MYATDVTIIVQKYGGSSVADVDRIGRVADKVVKTKREGHDVVVVVSAMGKTTDELLALARAVDPSPPRRELDMLLTTGERITMALLSMAIQKRGCDAISFTGSQSGIITNDRHFDARIIEVRPHRIEDELSRGRIVIIAGYQGMSYRREITTLGRGGSDTTAVAMAAALGAERVEIYSDVDGVYSADPRVVDDAQHLPILSYGVMQEMAEAGAKVLNAAAVELAKTAKIHIHARSTFGGDRETIVGARDAEGSGVASVVGHRGLADVRAKDARALEATVATLGEMSIMAREVTADAQGGALLVSAAMTPDWTSARARLCESLGARIEIREEVALVSAVGDGFARDPMLATRVLSTMAEAGIQAERTWISPLRLSVVIAEGPCDALVRALHARFIAPKEAGA